MKEENGNKPYWMLRQEMLEICEPINRWLRDNWHPGAIIQINYDHVDLFTAAVGSGYDSERGAVG